MWRMPFVVIARITAKSGMEEQLKTVLEPLVAPTRAEAGCLQYDLMRSQSNPRLFTFYEKWASDEAFAAHGQAPHVVRARAERMELVEGPPDVGRWDLLS